MVKVLKFEYEKVKKGIIYVIAVIRHYWLYISKIFPTGWRLGAAAADIKHSAGYFRSCSHYTFSVVTAAVAPNRALCCCHCLTVYLHG